VLTLFSKHKPNPGERFIADVRRRGFLRAAVGREERWELILKRERWSESEILVLPAGEHDYFDRKAAPFLESREGLEKVVSALANSGGGHILVGVRDDGTLEGVSPARGRTPTREWLEQVIPTTVSPPLADFRVHEVEPDQRTSKNSSWSCRTRCRHW
jgi:hypothetical protein